MVDLDDLGNESYQALLVEKESLVDYIETETALGGGARTEYRQLEAVEQELESREK